MDTQESEGIFRQAVRLYRAGQYTEALMLLQHLDTNYPDIVNILFPKALCLAKLSRLEEAQVIRIRIQGRCSEKQLDKLDRLLEKVEGQSEDKYIADESEESEKQVLDSPQMGTEDQENQNNTSSKHSLAFLPIPLSLMINQSQNKDATLSESQVNNTLGEDALRPRGGINLQPKSLVDEEQMQGGCLMLLGLAFFTSIFAIDSSEAFIAVMLLIVLPAVIWGVFLNYRIRQRKLREIEFVESIIPLGSTPSDFRLRRNSEAIGNSLPNSSRYRVLLAALEAYPRNTYIHQEAVRIGRILKSGEWSAEPQIMNDIAAACAGKDAAESPATTVNLSNEITKLSELKNDGILSEEEFERAKIVLLGSPPDKAASVANSLRSLHDLMQEGVLSKGEFNLKKWDILSRNN